MVGESLKEIRVLSRTGKLSRAMEVKLNSKVFRTPIYFPSISSYGLRFTLWDLLHFLEFHSRPFALVSAYDLYRLEEEKRAELFSKIKRYMEKGVLFLDSGGYESSWKEDQRWDIDSYKSMMDRMRKFPVDVYSSFDSFKGDSMSDGDYEKQTYNNILESSVYLKNNFFVPILHQTTPVKLVSLVGRFVKKYPQLCDWIAVAERDCGAGLEDRMETIVLIRKILDDGNSKKFLHILGCGDPRSILAFSYCGVDSFDSTDWAKRVMNPSNHSSHHLSHLNLIDCTCYVCTSSKFGGDYYEKVLLHNLLYYQLFMDNIQSLIQNDILRDYLVEHIGDKVVKQLDLILDSYLGGAGSM